VVCLCQRDGLGHQLSVADLSVLNDFSDAHLFMLLKGYFNGGNQADSKQYKTVTLASIIGPLSVLRPFERSWNSNLKKHGASRLHTTDAMALQGIYADWKEPNRDAFVHDCVRIIDRFLVKEVDGHGIAPYTITIDLGAFKRAQSTATNRPQNANEVAATQSLAKMIEYGNLFGAHFFELIFDRGEPFYGQINNRLINRSFRTGMKKTGIDIQRRFSWRKADMRDVPALQAADLVAWGVGHRNDVRADWHRHLLDMRTESEMLDDAALSKPDMFAVNFIKHCRLPPSKPTP